MDNMLNLVLMMILIAAIAAAEQLLKRKIERSGRYGQKILYGHIEMRQVHNEGLLCGLFKNRRPLPQALSSAAIAALGVFLFLYMDKNAVSVGFELGVVLLLGGSVSNVLDRLRHGYVVDYFCFCKAFLRKFRNLVFNLADFYIFFGAVLIVLFS